MKTEVLVAIVGLGGVAIGSLSTLALTFLNRRFDDRRHLRQLAIETAVQYWKQNIEIGNATAKLTGQNVNINPLDTYIVHMLQLAEMISDKRITADNIQDDLARIHKVTDAASESAKQRAERHVEGREA
jgi:hypothetical protein